MINYDIETEIKPHLTSDEKLLWTGAPKQGVVFRGNDFFLLPFSIIWFGFFLFIWSNATSSENGPPVFFLYHSL